MVSQVKIKDIAEMAGVSVGTVDRVLHNRGHVSPARRKAVEDVLAEVEYKHNLHTSAVSLRKGYKIVVTIPTAIPGEFWDTVYEGIDHALQEYSDIKIECVFKYYNQFDIYSCRAVFDKIPEMGADAVIINPTFKSETTRLCAELDRRNIVYSFVDSLLEDANPISSFTTDQYICGYLLAKILKGLSERKGTYAMFRSSRIGNERSNNSYEKLLGFNDYFKECGYEGNVEVFSFSVIDPEESERRIVEFLDSHPDLIGIATSNSRGYIIADILKKYGRQDIRLVSFDLTDNNRRCIMDGSIHAVLCQHPMLQGFSAVKTILEYLLYNKKKDMVNRLMPIDILTKENLPFFHEIMD